MKQTKIDWCDCTLNPVIGCKNGCQYCYARKINDRFHFIDNWNEPQFFEGRLKQLYSKKPKSIFMDSMSDIEYWDAEWVETVLKHIKENRHHNYIFLTKNTGIHYNFFYEDSFNYLNNGKKYVFFGRTISSPQITNTDLCNFDFWSIEPLLFRVKLKDFEPLVKDFKLKQVIIGAETGNRKGKITPKKEWVDEIVEFCDKFGFKVFMKESLREIMGDDFRQDELIWAIKEQK